MHFIDKLFEKSKTVISLLVLLLITGFYTYVNIPKESFPDVNVPYIFTIVTYRGISPEDGERLIAKPIESKLKTLDNVKTMSTNCFEGGCQTILEFNAGFDSEIALQEVKDEVDAAKVELPQGADEPIVNEFDFSEFPILIINVTGQAPERTLLNISKKLESEIEAIPTVLDVEIAGKREEQVEVVINPIKVDAYKLSYAETGGFIARSNTLVAAGNLDTGKGKFGIKVPGLIETITDIMNLPMKVYKDSVITLSDIAKIRRNFKDPEDFARIQGEKALILKVKKRAGTNLIKTVESALQIVEQAKKLLKEKGVSENSVKIIPTQNQAEFVEQRILDLQNSVISAVLLVMVVIVIALGIRTGLLVGLAIPGSFLLGILFLNYAGLTINMIVLFALILAVGMLVDGAIVVTEYADRKMSEGVDKKDAYSEASRRMAMPVISSTATTLAAFMPLAFWPGMMGEFMKFFPITLIATLSASLIMALIFIPTLGAIYGKPGAVDEHEYEQLIAAEEGKFDKLYGYTKKYANILKWALKRPWKIFYSSIGTMILVIFLYGIFGAGVEFFPESEPDFLMINVRARGNLSLVQQDEIIKNIENQILDYPHFKPTIFTNTGAASENAPRDTIGYIQMELKNWQDRPKAKKIIKELKNKINSKPGVFIEIKQPEEGPVRGKPISIEVSSFDNEKLEAGIKYVREALETVGGFVDIEDTRPLPKIEWEIKVNRSQAAKFGVDIASIGQMVQMLTRGVKFSSYRPDDTDEEVDIMIRYPKEYRNLDQLRILKVLTPAGSIPISNFVTITPGSKTSNITRIDGKRVMTVESEVEEGVLVNEKLQALKKYYKKNPPPEDINIQLKGQSEDQKETGSFLLKAFLIAIFVMAIILVTQFNSFYSTFLILFAVILSIIGVLIGLMILQKPFGLVMSGIAVVSLAGIVVNNNIVLIDTYDQLKNNVKNPFDAIMRTGVQRLRPVMLTTITTILGLLPMMLMLNLDFVNREITIGSPSMAWWSELATSIIAGLTFATILTLIVTPCMLLIGAKSKQKKLIKQKLKQREKRNV